MFAHLQHRISGLPVIDRDGTRVGILTEGDFLHRSEIGTERKRNGLLATDQAHASAQRNASRRARSGDLYPSDWLPPFRAANRAWHRLTFFVARQSAIDGKVIEGRPLATSRVGANAWS